MGVSCPPGLMLCYMLLSSCTYAINHHWHQRASILCAAKLLHEGTTGTSSHTAAPPELVLHRRRALRYRLLWCRVGDLTFFELNAAVDAETNAQAGRQLAVLISSVTHLAGTSPLPRRRDDVLCSFKQITWRASHRCHSVLSVCPLISSSSTVGRTYCIAASMGSPAFRSTSTTQSIPQRMVPC